jgi:enamine deaminase RidA (YjgF/YER057c/UK114 family)
MKYSPGATFLAGQIGLVPPTMELPVPQDTAKEAALSLQHIFRVARAVKLDPLTGIEVAVVFIVDERDVSIVAETWRLRFEEVVHPLAIVLVDGLPRGARVEWHVIRCHRSSDEERRETTRIAFVDHDVITAISELRGDHEVLCSIYGSDEISQDIRKRWPNTALQTAPSRAVYSLQKANIIRHKFCAIITSELS